MKNKLIISGVVVASMMLLSTTMQALPYVNGTINMNGTVHLNDALAGADNASFVNPSARVSAASGSYSGVPTGVLGQLVDFSNFSWNPESTPVPSLWSFIYSGATYSFDLADITSVSQGANFLNIEGNGTAKITNYQDTYGTWSFTITSQDSGTTFDFGFGDSNTSVPDGGTTVMLLGAALSGLGLIRRKLVA